MSTYTLEELKILETQPHECEFKDLGKAQGYWTFQCTECGEPYHIPLGQKAKLHEKAVSGI